jgi:hypothetical protein
MRGASSAAKQAAKAATQKQEVARAEQTVSAYQEQFHQLQDEFAKEVAQVKAKFEAGTEQFESVAFSSKKTNVSVRLVALVWAPFRASAQGTLVPAFQQFHLT